MIRVDAMFTYLLSVSTKQYCVIGILSIAKRLLLSHLRVGGNTNGSNSRVTLVANPRNNAYATDPHVKAISFIFAWPTGLRIACRLESREAVELIAACFHGLLCAQHRVFNPAECQWFTAGTFCPWGPNCRWQNRSNVHLLCPSTVSWGIISTRTSI